MSKMGEQQTGEICVKTFIAGDELVGEGQSRHQAALLQPEDRCERSAEEDAFHGREGDETLSEGRVLILDPTNRPIGFLADAGD